MLFAGVGLLICIAVAYIISIREGVSGKKVKGAQAKPLGREGGFQLVIRDRYLQLIAAMIVLLNTVNTIGEYILGKLVVDYAEGVAATSGLELREVIANTYGDYFSWVNLLGLLFQLFLVSRIFKYIGVRGALFILPLIALGTYSLIAVIPMLAYVRVGKILENATDYSIQNTARHGLFLVTSREAKYKAQAAIETFFWRAGDVLQAGIVFAGTALLAFTTRHFAALNVVMVVIWLVLVVSIYRHHKRRSETQPQLEKQL
jgi:AAA family ATP:ADP antiporter